MQIATKELRHLIWYLPKEWSGIFYQFLLACVVISVKILGLEILHILTELISTHLRTTMGCGALLTN